MRLSRWLVLSAISAACVALQAHAATPAAPAAPAAQAGVQRWDLRDLYANLEAWTAALEQQRAKVQTLDRFKADFGKDAASVRNALVAISDTQKEVARLSVYASLNADEDLREPRAQERRQQANALWAQLSEKTAWLAPAVVALGAEKTRAFIAADPVLKARFDQYLDDTLRSAPHTLAPESEALLASAGQVLGQPQSVYEQLAEAELPERAVKLSNGKTIQMTPATYEQWRTSANRDDRKRVFDSFFSGYKKVEGSLGANLTTQVMGTVFQAKARRYEGALAAALFSDNMPPAVYRMLVSQAKAGLPTLHRYLKLRKKMLGLTGELAYYDNYVSLVKEPQGQHWDLARSKTTSLQALAPMGPEYLGHLKRVLDSNWTDTHPRPGKTSGAYVSGWGYDVHPYMLLNHNDDFESLSTLAHEAGHAVHTLLANAAQPWDKAPYSTFIAESASIGNEMLLSDYMVANAKTREEKLFYLSQGLESIRTTFFRQTQFAEFQLALHEEIEQGKPLSGQRISELYCGVLKRYYGEAEGVMKIDPAYCLEWAYIGHFYRGFYVWQYATSMVGAAEFSNAIQKPGAEGTAARDRFITMLKAGGSDYAYPLYVRAGVDLAQPGPYQALMARMNRLLDEFEKLSSEVSPRANDTKRIPKAPDRRTAG
jgi:oligoendopeptidase F